MKKTSLWCDSDTDGEVAPEPCKGSWDYNGDFWRCECGTYNMSGRCEKDALREPQHSSPTEKP